MKRILTLTLAAGLLCVTIGCALPHVVKTWEASGGSRADATVEVGFVYDPQRERPTSNEAQAYSEALKRCQAWGYQDAEPFGLHKEQCQRMGFVPFAGMVCMSMIVTQQYQCLGNGNSTSN